MADVGSNLEDESPPRLRGTSPAPGPTSGSAQLDTGTELAMRRTGMSFQRTRMSADRTLMSVIRTSLSLISFGFTIYQFLGRLNFANSVDAARNFGIALVVLGIAMIAMGIIYHIQFMWGLRVQRKELTATGLIYGRSQFPPSLTLIAAVLLLLLGLLAVSSMVFHFGPFE
jgi:inner membrane protein YidH